MNLSPHAKDFFEIATSFKKFHKNNFGCEDVATAELDFFCAMAKIMMENDDMELIPLSELSDALHISKSGLSQTINKLEDKGLISRVILPSDRRSTYVRFTEQGYELHQKSMRDINHFINIIVEKMGEEDLSTFNRLTKKIFHIISEESNEVPKNAQLEKHFKNL